MFVRSTRSSGARQKSKIRNRASIPLRPDVRAFSSSCFRVFVAKYANDYPDESTVSIFVRLHEVIVEREQRELEPAGDAGLVEDARQMVLDRVFADRQPPGDALVRFPFDDEREDFAFAARQAEIAVRGRLAGRRGGRQRP